MQSKGQPLMTTATIAANAKATPSYCPCCQRLYRRTPSNYLCVDDGTPLIDVNDPLPPTRVNAAMPLMGVLLTLSLAVGVGLTVI